MYRKGFAIGLDAVAEFKMMFESTLFGGKLKELIDKLRGGVRAAEFKFETVGETRGDALQ